MVSNHLAKFGGHRHCGSRDVRILFCHVVSPERRIMQLYEQESIKVSCRLAKFDGQKHCCIEGIMILICQVILLEHMTKRSFDFMGRSPSRQVTIPQSLVAIGTVVVEI